MCRKLKPCFVIRWKDNIDEKSRSMRGVNFASIDQGHILCSITCISTGAFY